MALCAEIQPGSFEIHGHRRGESGDQQSACGGADSVCLDPDRLEKGYELDARREEGYCLGEADLIDLEEGFLLRDLDSDIFLLMLLFRAGAGKEPLEVEIMSATGDATKASGTVIVPWIKVLPDGTEKIQAMTGLKIRAIQSYLSKLSHKYLRIHII